MKPAKTRATSNALGFFYRLPLLSALWPLVIHFEIVPQAGRHTLQVLSQEKRQKPRATKRSSPS